MIKRIDENHVEVANIIVDNKDATKEIIEHVLGTCLAPLGYYLTPRIANLNYETRIKYDGYMSIELFVSRIKENIDKISKGFQLNYVVDEKELSISISCTNEIYENSTYAIKEFMLNVRGREKMIINIKTDEVDMDNYYWFTLPGSKISSIKN